MLNTIKKIPKNIHSYFRMKKLHYLNFGFDPLEIWNLDKSIAEFIIPRLKVFRDHSPSEIRYDENGESLEQIENPLKRKEKTDQCFEDMIYAFSTCLEENWYKISDEERYKKGMKLFGLNFRTLWW